MLSFFQRNKSTVGLDIGSGFLKVVVVDHSGREPEITHLAYAPMVSDAIVEGDIMDPQLVVESVRALLADVGTKVKRVVTSVGGREVIVRRIQMDRMKPADARQNLRWEAAQHVTFDMDDVQLDFQILDPTGEGLQMNVLLVAAKREMIEQKIGLLKEAGVTPAVVDVDALALCNAFEYNYPQAMQGTVGLLNVGHEVSTLNVLQDGAPLLTRDLPFGSRRVQERLRRAHGLTAEEAEAVIQNQSPRQSEYASALAEAGEELALGIERAVAFLSLDNFAPGGLGRLYLCGGGARVPGLVEALAQRLRTRVEVANPLERLRLRPDATSLFPVEELAPMLMLGVGLALRRAA